MNDITLEDSELDENIFSTGDIILCHSNPPPGKKYDPGLDGIIEWATNSPWEHVVMVIKDPWWTNPPLKGIFVFQSGWGPNSYKDVLNDKVSGVTLNHINDFLANRQNIYIRKLYNLTFNKILAKKFVKAFQTAHGKPYDANPCHWLAAGLNSIFTCKCCNCLNPKHKSNYWCSALVAFMYRELGIIPKAIDWSNTTPAELNQIKLIEPYELGSLIKIK